MSKPRLLIIEDDRKIAELVSCVAREINFNVRITCDYAEIPSLYDEFMPQAIVLDIIMPGMDGFEVLDFLHKRHSSAFIIVLSGQEDYRPMIARMAEGLELAIIGTIAKPFRVAEVRQALESIKSSLPPPDGNSTEVAA